MQPLDLLDDKPSLIMLVAGHMQHQRIAGRIFRPHRFRLAAGIVVDQGIGRIEDHLGRAVILLQFDYRSFRVIFFKIKDVADIGAAPAVNALVRIADHAEVAVLCRQHPGQCVLRVVGVLIFIDQDIAKPLLVFFPHRRELFQQTHRHIHQIIKIHRIVRQQLLLVQTVHGSHPLLVVIVGLCGKPLWCEQLILGVGNGPDHTAD